MFESTFHIVSSCLHSKSFHFQFLTFSGFSLPAPPIDDPTISYNISIYVFCIIPVSDADDAEAPAEKRRKLAEDSKPAKIKIVLHLEAPGRLKQVNPPPPTSPSKAATDRFINLHNMILKHVDTVKNTIKQRCKDIAFLKAAIRACT
jgi:hypothetical protein